MGHRGEGTLAEHILYIAKDIMQAFIFAVSKNIPLTLVYTYTTALLLALGWDSADSKGAAFAQVIPDGTLPTIVTSSGNTFTIEGGARSGNNLFHSFGQFSVPTGGAAIFNNAVDVQNIFSRVTGGGVSSIDGLIQANGSTNLFLLNPNGILFGPNATLNIGGSFIGTTAESVKFADGIEFSAANLTAAPLLTISVPIGLQMGQNPGTIVNQSQNFAVSPHQTLALVGGDLLLQGISGYVYLYAPDGHIELGSVGSNSLVALASSAVGWSFDYGNVSEFQDMRLTQSAFVDTSGDGGGTIQLQGRNIQLQDGSQVYSQTLGAVSGGGITVQAHDSLLISGISAVGDRSGLISVVTPGATGDAGNILIQTPNLGLTDGGTITSVGYGDGNVGNLTLQADRVNLTATTLSGFSGIISTYVGPSATGQGGNITLNTQWLTLSAGSQILANTEGVGNTGNVTIRATTLEASALPTDSLATGIYNSVLPGATGNGGTLTIAAQQLSLTGGASLSAGTYGAGNSGNIVVQATNLIADNTKALPYVISGLRAAAFPGSTGNAGSITIDAQTLTLLNGARLSASTASTGQGGNITVRSGTVDLISDRTQNQASLIATSVASGGMGNAGNIIVATKRLTLDGGQIVAATLERGNAGNITIYADNILATGAFNNGLSPSGIFTAVAAGAQGNAGVLDIVSDRLQLQQGGEISSSTYGRGNAGQISIRASDFIRVEGVDAASNAPSNISSAVNPQASGTGGDLSLQTGQLQIIDGGQINSSTAGQGSAGNINALVGTLIVQGTSPDGTSPSFLAALSQSNSDAGSLTVTAGQARLNQGGIITVASTGRGNAGQIGLVVSDRLELNNGKISSDTHDGQGGRIQLVANQLQLDNDSLIGSNTTGTGNAGEVTVTANAIALTQSTISSQSFSLGNSGTLRLVTGSLGLGNNALLSTAAANAGSAGDLMIQASNSVTLQSGSQISSRSTGSGRGGTIDLTARSLLLNQNSQVNASTAASDGGNLRFTVAENLQLRDHSLLNAEAGGTGTGGNITLNTPFVIGFGNSDIIANAFQGRGGTIQITTDGIFGLKFRNQLTPDNDITASSQFGLNGTVQINLLSIDPTSSLAALRANLIAPNQQITQGCAANQGSSFVISGRGGMQENPNYQVISYAPWADLRPFNLNRPIAAHQPAVLMPPAPLTEANGWRRHANGAMELFAERLTTSLPKDPMVSCTAAGRLIREAATKSNTRP